MSQKYVENVFEDFHDCLTRVLHGYILIQFILTLIVSPYMILNA